MHKYITSYILLNAALRLLRHFIKDINLHNQNSYRLYMRMSITNTDCENLSGPH